MLAKTRLQLPPLVLHSTVQARRSTSQEAKLVCASRHNPAFALRGTPKLTQPSTKTAPRRRRTTPAEGAHNRPVLKPPALSQQHLHLRTHAELGHPNTPHLPTQEQLPQQLCVSLRTRPLAHIRATTKQRAAMPSVCAWAGSRTRRYTHRCGLTTSVRIW